MKFKSFAIFFLLGLSLLTVSCNAASIKTISMDYPHGTDRLLVRASGETMLFYGALMGKSIKPGIFTVDELYNKLKGRLHKNAPTETWPNPLSTAGMVQIGFSDGTQKDYLIFDEEEFAEGIFKRAKENVYTSWRYGEMPPTPTLP